MWRFVQWCYARIAIKCTGQDDIALVKWFILDEHVEVLATVRQRELSHSHWTKTFCLLSGPVLDKKNFRCFAGSTGCFLVTLVNAAVSMLLSDRSFLRCDM